MVTFNIDGKIGAEKIRNTVLVSFGVKYALGTRIKKFGYRQR